MLNVYVYLQLEGVYQEPIRKSIETICDMTGRSKKTVLGAIKGLCDIKFITYNPARSQYSLCEFTIVKRNGKSTGGETTPVKQEGSGETTPVRPFIGGETTPPTTPVNPGNPRQSTLLPLPKISTKIKDKRTRHSATPKSTGKETLPVTPKPLTPIHQVVEAYKIAKGFENIASWDDVNFSGHIKAAKKLLLLAGGNVELAIAGMKAIGKVLDERGFSTWGLDATVRQFSQYLVEKKRGEEQ